MTNSQGSLYSAELAARSATLPKAAMSLPDSPLPPLPLSMNAVTPPRIPRHYLHPGEPPALAPAQSGARARPGARSRRGSPGQGGRSPVTRVLPPPRERRPALPPRPGAPPGGAGGSGGGTGEVAKRWGSGESNSWSRAGNGAPRERGGGRAAGAQGRRGMQRRAPRPAPPALRAPGTHRAAPRCGTGIRSGTGSGAGAAASPARPEQRRSGARKWRERAGSARGRRERAQGGGGAAAQHRGHRPCGRACADPDVPGGGQQQVTAQARPAASALRMHLLRLRVSRARAGERKRGGRARRRVGQPLKGAAVFPQPPRNSALTSLSQHCRLSLSRLGDSGAS